MNTEPDDDGPSLSASFKFTLDAVSGLSARMERVARRLERPPMQPVSRSFPASVTIPAAGFVVAQIIGPDQGHVWYVRSIVIGGATPATAAAGRADIFVSAADLRQSPSAAAIGLGGWRDSATTLPQVAFYGRGELKLVANEDLFVALSGATATQQYTAIAYVEDFQDAPIAQDFSE